MRLGTDMSLCLYAGGSFEPNEFVLLAQVLKPGMVFVDGGANEGLYSLFASKRVSPEGLVIAVEPSSRELERLKANIKLNRASNIRPRQAALGQGSGTAELAIAEAGHEGQNTVGQAVSNPTVATVGHEKVDLVTLDELVEREGLSRVDFVKLDVEGSEFDALRGATETLVRHRPLLQLEIEEERLASQNATKDEVLQLLETAGYSVYVFDGVTAQLRPPRRPDEPEGNAIAAPRDWSPPVLPATPRRR
jgi:FkbM family methyltransferase